MFFVGKCPCKDEIRLYGNGKGKKAEEFGEDYSEYDEEIISPKIVKKSKKFTTRMDKFKKDLDDGEIDYENEEYHMKDTTDKVDIGKRRRVVANHHLRAKI